jgi:phosphoribosylformimino-5-aminoimidazole carboxamide ribotide isomerase
MQIWPAIDLRQGKCVRLRQGDYARETVFGDDPAAMARRWVGAGARRLHVVDLDGAKGGERVNRDAVAAIVAAVDVPCQLGGGVRDEESVRELLALGIERLVIGTKALEDPAFVQRVCQKYPQRIVLGIDAKYGLVATDGWLKSSDVSAVELARRFSDEPLAAIVYTDIAKDGMLAGPNLVALEEMRRATTTPVIASGGVSSLDDVRRIAALGLAGCIIGRAIYEGTLDLTEAIEAAGDLPASAGEKRKPHATN